MATTVLAAKKTDTPNSTNTAKLVSVKVTKAVCTSAGKINVNFKQKVAYSTDVKAVITDAGGQSTDTKITKRTSASCAIAATGMTKGGKYTVTITGVKVKGTQDYTTVSAAFTAKTLKTAAKPAKITRSGKVITLKFTKPIACVNPSAIVIDESGNTYKAVVSNTTKTQIKVKVTGLKSKKKYTITVNGVKLTGESNYADISKTFSIGNIK